ncbi:hypothetical protein Tco_0944083 [Tanacetum coccineum]
MFTDTVVKLNLQKLCLVAMSSVHESEQLHLVRWWKLGGVSGSREVLLLALVDGKGQTHGKNEGRWHKIVYEKDPTEPYCTSCSKQGYSKSNFKLRSKKSSTTDAANKEKSKQQPSAPNSNAYRKKSSQGQRGKAPPRQVYRPTGKTVQSSFENTYNLPKKTADNQTEQNLFLLINNKKTSQHIQISADPSTSTASHDSQLRVDSSHQVIVDAIDSSLAANNSNVDNSSPAIEETSNHSRHEAPEKAWRTSFVESSIGPNAYHMGDRPVRQRTMLDFSINFLISRLTDIYLIEPQRTERANVVKAKAEKPRAAPAREIKVERADISTAFGCSAFARIAAFLTGNGPLKSNPRSFDSVHLVARPSFALTLRCLLWPIGEPLKAALLKKGDTSCHLAEPTSLLAANRTTKKMRRNHRSLSFKPLRRIGRMKASKKQLTLRRIPLCDSDEEGGRSDRRRKFIGEQRRRDWHVYPLFLDS